MPTISVHEMTYGEAEELHQKLGEHLQRRKAESADAQSADQAYAGQAVETPLSRLEAAADDLQIEINRLNLDASRIRFSRNETGADWRGVYKAFRESEEHLAAIKRELHGLGARLSELRRHIDNRSQ